MNIVEVLCRHAASRPDAPAIWDVHRGSDRALSFADLEALSSRYAALLEGSGVKAGDAVLIFQPMSAELYTALLGVFRIGAIAMFLDPSAGREHIEQCCKLWPPAALVAGTKAHLLRAVSRELRKIPRKFVIGWPVPGAIRWVADQPGPVKRSIASCAEGEPALLTFTSGSTGRPKATLRTHGFLLAQHRVLEKTLGLRCGDVDLTTLPIFVLANLGSGVTSVIPDADLRRPGAINAAPVVAQIMRHRPVSAAASPAFFERLSEYCLSHGQTLTTFKKIFTGGAPVFPRTLDALQKLAPQATVTAVYGSTEAEPIAEIPYAEIGEAELAAMHAGQGLLAGRPVADIHLRILRNRWGSALDHFTEAEFATECLAPGEAGEIVVSGKHVLQGYVGGHGDEETKFRVDGRVWHRTGDSGFLDAAGRLWLLGRCEAQIHDERGAVFPFAVECVAMQFSGVRRAAMVAHRGRRALAIEREPNVSIDLTALQRALAWAHIDHVKVLGHLPVDKRHNAKINYPELRKLLDRER